MSCISSCSGLSWVVVLSAVVVLLVCYVEDSLAAPIGSRRCNMDAARARRHLVSYGYGGTDVKYRPGRLERSDDYEAAMRLYQEVRDLPVTGVLDDATCREMTHRLCGVPDTEMIERRRRRISGTGGARRRTKRYATHSAWPSPYLTYGITSLDDYPTGSLSTSDVDSIMTGALQKWAAVSALRFTEDKSNPELKVLFAAGNHSDFWPFDGPKGVLAHASYPGTLPYRAGDAHFDKDETWITHDMFKNGIEGVVTEAVALHEFGHSLGLSHTDVKGASMYPAYVYDNPVTDLHMDDIAGIRELYCPCKNGGVCNTENKCTCTAEWTGENCETKQTVCSSNPCQYGGTCREENSGYTCTCTAGWTGTNCETEQTACSSNPCQYGGTCREENSGYTCTCTAGWTGTNCETKQTACSSNPCQYGGTCREENSRYTCICTAGWTGTNCETKQTACSSNPCQYGGTCNEGNSGYTCTCTAGWTGTNCETKQTACSSNPCQYGGTCNEGNNGYTCTCTAGWTGTNCETKQTVCSSNPCQYGGTCNEGNSGYTCTCTAGWTGTNCETKQTACSSNPCQYGGTCNEGNSGYTCTCTAGWTGTNCETKQTVCSSNPCQYGGTCNEGNSGYTCTCTAGWTGTNCETKQTVCSSNPCQYGGTCNEGNSGYTCTCTAGWTGTNCETKQTVCSSNPCQYGGTCNEGNSGYTCICTAGWTGTNCETKQTVCSSNPCQYGGTCNEGNNGYTCACTSGWTGNNCETPVNNACQIDASFMISQTGAFVTIHGDRMYTHTSMGAHGDPKEMDKSVSRSFRTARRGAWLQDPVVAAMDTIAVGGSQYVFLITKNHIYPYRIRSPGVVRRSPERNGWSYDFGPVDAAMIAETGGATYAYLYKGSTVYRYKYSDLDLTDLEMIGTMSTVADIPKYPTSYHAGFDTVLNPSNTEYYYFKSSQYIKVSSEGDQSPPATNLACPPSSPAGLVQAANTAVTQELESNNAAASIRRSSDGTAGVLNLGPHEQLQLGTQSGHF